MAFKKDLDQLVLQGYTRYSKDWIKRAFQDLEGFSWISAIDSNYQSTSGYKHRPRAIAVQEKIHQSGQQKYLVVFTILVFVAWFTRFSLII